MDEICGRDHDVKEAGRERDQRKAGRVRSARHDWGNGWPSFFKTFFFLYHPSFLRRWSSRRLLTVSQTRPSKQMERDEDKTKEEIFCKINLMPVRALSIVHFCSKAPDGSLKTQTINNFDLLPSQVRRGSQAKIQQ